MKSLFIESVFLEEMSVMPFELSLSHIAARQATVLLDVFVGSNFLRFLLFFRDLQIKVSAKI